MQLLWPTEEITEICVQKVCVSYFLVDKLVCKMRAHWGISIKGEVLHQLVLDFSSFLKKKIRQAKTPVPAKEQSLKL